MKVRWFKIYGLEEVDIEFDSSHLVLSQLSLDDFAFLMLEGYRGYTTVKHYCTVHEQLAAVEILTQNNNVHSHSECTCYPIPAHKRFWNRIHNA
jgi:hypothetical protein